MAGGFARGASKFAIGALKGFKGGRETTMKAKFALAKANRSEKVRQQRLQEGLQLGVERDRLQEFAKRKSSDSQGIVLKNFLMAKDKEMTNTGFFGKNANQRNTKKAIQAIISGDFNKLPSGYSLDNGNPDMNRLMTDLGGQDSLVQWGLENDPETTQFAFPAVVERLLNLEE